MIKMICAHTNEIDDIDAATNEILEQINAESLLNNSVGIAHCYTEFVGAESVFEHLCARLAFDVVGSTTAAEGCPGYAQQAGFSIAVLTSDDICFWAGVSGESASAEDIKPAVCDLFDAMTAHRHDTPALLLSFLPYEVSRHGFPTDEFLVVINSLAKSPVFGAVSSSSAFDFSGSAVLFNGKEYPTSAGLIALWGDVRPQFYSIWIANNSIMREKLRVTKSDAMCVYEIEGVPAAQYLEKIGIATDDVGTGLIMTPCVFYLNDGSKVTRTIVEVKDGSLVFGSLLPDSDLFAFAVIETDDVMNSARQLSREVKDKAEGRCAIINSCTTRLWSMGENFSGEMDVIDSAFADTGTEYIINYVNGEIFPNETRNVSFIQNNTLIFCLL